MAAFRFPSVRRRVVNRGKFLMTHPPFLKEVARQAQAWDREHPAFAIGERMYPTEEKPPVGAICVYPLPLIKVIDASNRRMNSRPHRPDLGPEEQQLEDAAFTAAFLWRTLVLELCQAWWPPEYFPNWMGRHDHPAAMLVSACLLWDPKLFYPSFSQRWVSGQLLSPIGFVVDPRDHDKQPDVLRWRETYCEFARLIEDAVQQGRRVTAEFLAEAERAAWSAGATAAARAQPKGQRWGEGPWFVHLHRGITTSDWRELERRIFRDGEMPSRMIGERLEEHARALKARGESDRRIAGILGISTKAVSALLR